MVSAKEQNSARSARHRSFALQPANHGPSERFDAPETAGLYAAAASLPSRRGLGDDDRAAGRRHADYEYGLHLNQLDLVTAFAGDRPDGRLATVPSPGATHLSILTSSKCSPLPCRSRAHAKLRGWILYCSNTLFLLRTSSFLPGRIRTVLSITDI